MSQSCCQNKTPAKPGSGLWQAVACGLLPHSFCILFLLFSLLGSLAGMGAAKKFLLMPNFFWFLVLLSLLFDTLSAVLYMRKNACCSLAGARQKWKYLLALYSLTLVVNASFLYLVFPAAAAFSLRPDDETLALAASRITIAVDIPCSGHAPLIISEIKNHFKNSIVSYRLPNVFEIDYDPEETSAEQILSLSIFKTYRARIY